MYDAPQFISVLTVDMYAASTPATEYPDQACGCIRTNHHGPRLSRLGQRSLRVERRGRKTQKEERNDTDDQGQDRVEQLTDLRVELVAGGHEALRGKPLAAGWRGRKEQPLDDEGGDGQGVEPRRRQTQAEKRLAARREHRLVNRVHAAGMRDDDWHQDDVADQKNPELQCVGIRDAIKSGRRGVAGGNDAGHQHQLQRLPAEDRAERRTQPRRNIAHENDDEAKAHEERIDGAVTVREAAAVTHGQQFGRRHRPQPPPVLRPEHRAERHPHDIRNPPHGIAEQSALIGQHRHGWSQPGIGICRDRRQRDHPPRKVATRHEVVGHAPSSAPHEIQPDDEHEHEVQARPRSSRSQSPVPPDRRPQRADPVDLANDLVASAEKGFSGADACAGRRACRDDVAGLERHDRGRLGDQRRDVEDHVGRVALLPQFAVDGQPDAECVWIRDLVRGDDPRAAWANPSNHFPASQSKNKSRSRSRRPWRPECSPRSLRSFRMV